MKPIPEIGKEYHFWDDGKISVSRHYICRVERIISPEEAKEIMFSREYTVPTDMSLYQIWEDEKSECTWLYADDTDCFVEISCPKYDDNLLYCARTKSGGFFSMNIQSFWQSGELDVDGKIFEDVIENRKEFPEVVEEYLNETYS